MTNLVLVDVTILVSALVSRSDHCFCQLTAPSLRHEYWGLLTPSKLLRTPAGKSEWPNDSWSDLSKLLQFFPLNFVSTKVSRVSQFSWGYNILSIFLCTCWHAEGQEATKSARTSQMLSSGLAPGRAGPVIPVPGSPLRRNSSIYSSSARVGGGREGGHRHCPSTAMSIFLNCFLQIEIIWWDEQKLTQKKYFYPSMTNNKWSKLSQFWTSLSVVYRRVRRAYVGCPAPNSSENSFSFNQIINLTKRLQVWV